MNSIYSLFFYKHNQATQQYSCKKYLIILILFTLHTTIVLGQTGSTCENPIQILNLPFNNIYFSSVFGDYYADVGANCSASPMNGNDAFFRYTPPVDQVVNIELLNPTVPNTAILIYDDCVDIGTSCLEVSINPSSSSHGVYNLNLAGGNPYFIMISNLDNEDFLIDLNIAIAEQAIPNMEIQNVQISGNTSTSFDNDVMVINNILTQGDEAMFNLNQDADVFFWDLNEPIFLSPGNELNFDLSTTNGTLPGLQIIRNQNSSSLDMVSGLTNPSIALYSEDTIIHLSNSNPTLQVHNPDSITYIDFSILTDSIAMEVGFENEVYYLDNNNIPRYFHTAVFNAALPGSHTISSVSLSGVGINTIRIDEIQSSSLFPVPEVETISTLSGTYRDTFTIAGGNMGYIQEVIFNDSIPAEFNLVGENENGHLEIIVPDNTVPGVMQLLDYNGNLLNWAGGFNVLPSVWPPSDIQSRIIRTDSTTSVKLYWDDVPHATSYIVEYKMKGSSSWLATTVTDNEIYIDNLALPQQYKYRVKSISATLNVASSFSGTGQFSTAFTPVIKVSGGLFQMISQWDGTQAATLQEHLLNVQPGTDVSEEEIRTFGVEFLEDRSVENETCKCELVIRDNFAPKNIPKKNFSWEKRRRYLKGFARRKFVGSSRFSQLSIEGRLKKRNRSEAGASYSFYDKTNTLETEVKYTCEGNNCCEASIGYRAYYNSEIDITASLDRKGELYVEAGDNISFSALDQSGNVIFSEVRGEGLFKRIKRTNNPQFWSELIKGTVPFITTVVTTAITTGGVAVAALLTGSQFENFINNIADLILLSPIINVDEGENSITFDYIKTGTMQFQPNERKTFLLVPFGGIAFEQIYCKKKRGLEISASTKSDFALSFVLLREDNTNNGCCVEDYAAWFSNTYTGNVESTRINAAFLMGCQGEWKDSLGNILACAGSSPILTTDIGTASVEGDYTSSDGGCPANVTFGEGCTISPGLYIGSETLTASGLIPLQSEVTFQAGNSVLLDAGFEIRLGAVLSISCQPCEVQVQQASPSQ